MISYRTAFKVIHLYGVYKNKYRRTLWLRVHISGSQTLNKLYSSQPTI